MIDEEDKDDQLNAKAVEHLTDSKLRALADLWEAQRLAHEKDED